MNELLIVVGIIFLICILNGVSRGFIKIVASLAATIAIIVLVAIATPFVSDTILKVTPIEEFTQEKCSEILGINQESQEDEQENIEEKEFTREEQITMLENAKLPDFVKELLLENNNTEIYESLGVSKFSDYVGSYLAKLFANIIGFLLAFLIISIVVRTVLYMLGIISDLPVIGGLNRLAGGVLGLGTGLIVVWVLFIVITLMYDTEIGKMCFENIAENKLLTLLYDNNILMNYITKFRV